MAFESCNGYREGFEKQKRNKKELMVCDDCGWESNDDWKQNDHFKKTGHKYFTPKSLMLKQNREIREQRQREKDALFEEINNRQNKKGILNRIFGSESRGKKNE